MCPTTVIYLPLVRANAFIGVEQYHERSQTIFEEAFRLRGKIDSERKSKNSFLESCGLVQSDADVSQDHCPDEEQRLNIETTNDKAENDEGSYTLVRCDAVIGLDLLTKKRKRSSESTASSISLDSLPKRRKLWDKTKTSKSADNPTLAKSRQMQRSMSRERLLRLEKAIQEWNAQFGTQYTIL